MNQKCNWTSCIISSKMMNRAWLHSWKLNLLSSGTLELKFLENTCFTLLQVAYYLVRINLCILVHQGTLLPLWYLLAGSDFPRWIKPSRPHRQTDLYGFRIQVFKQCICDHRFLPCQKHIGIKASYERWLMRLR